VVLALVVAIGAAGAVLAAYITHLARPATDETATKSTAIRLGVSTTSLVTLATVAPTSSAVEGVVQLLLPAGTTTRSATAAAVGDGHLITSAKTVAGVTAVTAVMSDGSKQDAKVAWVDHESGTAVLDIEQPSPTLASGHSATLAPGDEVTVAGSDTAGKVEAVGVEATADDGTHMAHLMKLRMEQPVADGAVLLDRRDRAVGICVGHVHNDESAALVAPIELARAATAATWQDGERRLAWLGITGRPATYEELLPPEDPSATATTTPGTESVVTTVSSATATNTTDAASTSTSLPPPTSTTAAPSKTDPVGAYVLAVDKGGPAAAAGLEEGDVVVALDGVQVRSMNALVLLVRERKAGGIVHLTVERAGGTIMLDAVLKDRPYDAPPDTKPSSGAPIRT
jgi:putative serine protease PepD